MKSSNMAVVSLGLYFLCVSIQSTVGRNHFGGNHEAAPLPNVQAMTSVVSDNSDNAINRWMLMRRDLLNITIDTDKIDEQPLTADDLLLRMKLMAYVQKLVDKEEKKKLKVAKKAEKAKAKAALLGLPAELFGSAPPATVSPPLPVPTSVNLSGSEPLPPTGFWLYKKAEFLTKLFSALAEAAATLPGVTTEPPTAEVEGDADAEDTTDENDETETPEEGSIANINDKRSVDASESSEEYEDADDEDGEYEERVYIEEPATKVVKSHRREPKKHFSSKNKYHTHKPAHKFHRHNE